MIQMMNDMGVNVERHRACRRIHELEVARRAQIINAVGRDLSAKIVIMGNGSLWTRTEDIKLRAQIIDGLAKANVNAFGQWTPLPPDDYALVEGWQEAGQPKGD